MCPPEPRDSGTRLPVPPVPLSSLSVAHGTHEALDDDRRAFGYIPAPVWPSPESYVVDSHHLREAGWVRSAATPRPSEISTQSSTSSTYIRDTHSALVQPEAIPESVLERIR